MRKNSPPLKQSYKRLPTTLFFTVFPYVLLVIICLLPFMSFLPQGLPVTHDGKDHVARIANFYQNLKEGVIVPRWAPNLNWGYGHPILMFLYPLPSYLGSLFHFLGFSFIDSVKMVFFTAYIFSGFTMYVWVSRILNKYSAFLASILYLFAPYRFVDIHVRGAIGEHVAFIFPPLVLYFLWKLAQKKDVVSLSLTALSLCAMLLSHNAISIMFLPIFLLYSLYLIIENKEKKKYVLYTTSAYVLGFTLSAFFLVPALLEGKYTLRDIVTSFEYSKRFVPFDDFLFGPWSFGGSHELSKQIGIVHWIGILANIYATYILFKQKNRLWQISLSLIVLFITTLWIMTNASDIIWSHITILQNFQFPWRFLSLSVFLTSLSGGIVLYTLPKKFQVIFTAVLSILIVVVSSGYWQINGMLQKSDHFFTSIYEGTTDTGESAPIWSVRFMEKKPKAPMDVVEGKADIVSIQRVATKHVYTVTASEKARLRENTLYFPGWEITIDGVYVQPEFQDPKHRGLMTFYVEKGTHTVEIFFTETKIRLLANTLSILSFLIIGVFCIMKGVLLWKHSR